MGNPLPLVSIILPTYNGSQYLRQSIESCRKQTYPDIELIIVDDASTDMSPEIIKSYDDPRIQYVRHSKNKGLPSALNTGLANSKGEYLTWTSDDNRYLPNAIKEMKDALFENRNADLVYADYWIHGMETNERELRRLSDALDLKGRNSVGPCFLFTRRVYQALGGYDSRYKFVEDYEYWIRMHERFRAIHCPCPLYIYRMHSKSLTYTRGSSIFLLDKILKYQHKFISRTELGDSLMQYSLRLMRNVSSGKTSPKEAAIVFVGNGLRVFRLSILLGLLCTVLMIYNLSLKVLQRTGERE
jgi:glycosyltransferase involved in cell wall biosynthesis